MATTGATPTQTSTITAYGYSFITLSVAFICLTVLLNAGIYLFFEAAMARTKRDQYYRIHPDVRGPVPPHVPTYWQCHPVRDAVLGTMAMVGVLAAMWVRGWSLMHDSLCAEADVRNVVSDLLVRKCFSYALKLVLESAVTVANWGHLLVLLSAIEQGRAP
ncbi:hypothetical protein LTR12_008508 [Friedmanniomyces endolithicus]|nr:hypothetical protein LTR12_008508 [Friedmanniomyces endolithicus]TKA37692.1 hypothetical protein B0A54_11776 [Friedmanniomyces endolithicus]